MRLAVGVVLLPLLLAAEPAPNSARRTPVVNAVQKCMPSVANIGTEEIVRVTDPFDTYFNEFFGAHQKLYKESIPLGSGVIVEPSGLILTNYHVVRRASRLLIRLFDGKTYAARPLAGDPLNDLALLQLQNLPADLKLQAIDFASPDDILLGETVVAVGNPFGLEHSVSVGVVSARNRSLKEGERVFNDILQTDAAINPGNSGGPLINTDAQLIGINLAIRRDAEGIGFAIPLRRIEQVLAHWLVPSRFSLGTCGFVPLTRVTDGTIDVIASEIDPDGPAATAGLKDGERILQANGVGVNRALDVGRILWRLKPGDKLALQLAGGRSLTITIPEMEPTLLIRQRLGLQVQELTAPLLKAMGLPTTLRGLAISEVQDTSPLAEFGVRRGDIITHVSDAEITSPAQVAKVLRDTPAGNGLAIGLVTVQNLRGQILLQQYRLTVPLR